MTWLKRIKVVTSSGQEAIAYIAYVVDMQELYICGLEGARLLHRAPPSTYTGIRSANGFVPSVMRLHGYYETSLLTADEAAEKLNTRFDFNLRKSV